MNKWQKLVQQQYLNNEEIVITKLEVIYDRVLTEIEGKVKSLEFDIDGLKWEYDWADDADKEVIQSKIQSKIYQKQYQEQLYMQLGTVYDEMKVEGFNTISEYLDTCYTDGFIGTMFDMHGQGVPLMMPIDQAAMVRAVQLDSKISKGLYTKLGEDVGVLKKRIASEVTRSIATGSTYQQVAQRLAGQTRIGYNKAIRIARTEGHRIQTTAAMDAMEKAKDMGADVVKQWDATLDDRTRESHAMVDGEIRELKEPFSNGLMLPGDPDGGAAEVINCRCALHQRARWALDEDELKVLEDRAAYFGLDKTQQFEEFKAKYLNAVDNTPAVKPKKEYLTEKKLKSNIADIEEKQKWLVEGSDEWQQLEDLKTDYQDKLNKKVTAKETKKLKKEQIQLQDELDKFDTDEKFSGIWYNQDVDITDWKAKHDAGSIQKKIDYYEDHIANATAYGHTQDEIDKFIDLLNKTKDFDQKGAAYYDVTSRLAKNKADLTKLQKSGKIVPSTSPYSQERKDAALWFDESHGGFRAADAYFDPPSKAIHGAASRTERDGFYTYTSRSDGHNRPLAGFQKPWSEPGTGWEERFYVGPGKVWIDFEGKGDQIRGLTTLIQKSTYNDDVWLQSGQGFGTLEGFLGIPYGSLSRLGDADLQQYVGYRNVLHQFLSTAVNKGGGSMFNEKPMKFNIFAPKGSQMLYASDCGAFGKGENEMILQRGATYEITRIYWGIDATDGNDRKLFVDLELRLEEGYDLFQQDPSEWTGSKKNYRN